MSEIRIEDGTINYEGDWLSSDDITQRIQEKMESGDMKFAGLAAALEELKQAMESAYTIAVSITLSRDDYDRLTEKGGGDDQANVMKAIQQFIGEAAQPAVPPPVPDAAEKEEEKAEDVVIEPDQAKKVIVKCSKCKHAIEVAPGVKDIECPNCGTSGRVKPMKPEAKNADKNEPKHQDHFIG